MNEQINPAENPREQTATPNQMAEAPREVIGIDPTTFDKVVQYLSNRPWGEVATIMTSLSQAIKVQVNG